MQRKYFHYRIQNLSPINFLLTLTDVSDDIQGFVISLSDELLHLSTGNSLPKAFDGHLQDFILPLTRNEIEYLDKLHLIIYNSLKHEMSSSKVVIQLVGALL